MRVMIPLVLLALAGCTQAQFEELFPPAAPELTEASVTPEARPPTLDTTPPPPPPPTATTVEEFDTTTVEDRAAALAPVPEPAGEQRLGTTLATLGDPADPGIWISTPLVSELVMGRVEVPGTGRTVTLELRPSGGEAGSGSEISLPAMRLLEVPLTAIQELIVYTGGVA